MAASFTISRVKKTSLLHRPTIGAKSPRLFFAAPPYHGHAAALDRVLGYIDFRKSILQGAFILAKAQGSAQVAADSVDHLCRYVELLFGVRRSPARM